MPEAEVVDPLVDGRWQKLVERHGDASVFHTTAWLDALRRTYGYEPLVVTKSNGKELTNGIVLCRICCRWTGNRIVSLPYSDHCEPLAQDVGEVRALVDHLLKLRGSEACKYVELRPRSYRPEMSDSFAPAAQFYAHTIDLRNSLQHIMGEFHESCVLRKIRRAERERLACESGTSESLLSAFYNLQVLTRRRHHLPPQPLLWFRNLVHCFGNALSIRIAFKDERAVAGILTLTHRQTLVYKYACSDPRFSHLGGTALLLWNAIQEAHRAGLQQIDMGRSDVHQKGLIAFKERWGCKRSELTYWRSPVSACCTENSFFQSRVVNLLIERAPARVLAFAGTVLYRYYG
jgi:lipid II:glycine glycyltransferase (peptidoglycan interpeptide bridge formation enzyme)